jgi:hypothetical protein
MNPKKVQLKKAWCPIFFIRTAWRLRLTDRELFAMHISLLTGLRVCVKLGGFLKQKTLFAFEQNKKLDTPSPPCYN